MDKSNNQDKKYVITFALVLISIAFILILVYYVLFPIIKPNLEIPCTANIIISTLLAFGTAFGIKLMDKK